MFEGSPVPDAERGLPSDSRPFPHALHQAGRGDRKELIKEQGTLPYGERPFCFGLSSGKYPETGARRSGVMLWELVLCLLGWARWGKEVCPWSIRESATVICFTGSYGGGMPPPAGIK